MEKKNSLKITVLAGGVGAAKFLQGLIAEFPPEQVTVIANTGDDAEFHELHVSPDIDTIIYTLAGLIDPVRGWGLRDETFHCLEALNRLGRETWFQLGDRDLATHLFRTGRLVEGATLTQVTSELALLRGLALRILPMTDQPAPTRLTTSEGELGFQEYFVQRRQEPQVEAVDLSFASRCTPAPGVLDAITQTELIIVAPSNPIISIGPILAVQELRDALRETSAPVIAISPIVSGKALKGPADRMLASLGHEASAAAIASLYSDFLDLFVLDKQDENLRERIEGSGIRTLVTDTIMSNSERRQSLARTVLESASRLQTAPREK